MSERVENSQDYEREALNNKVRIVSERSRKVRIMSEIRSDKLRKVSIMSERARRKSEHCEREGSRKVRIMCGRR